MAAITELYGHSLRKECFTMYDGLRNFNHGSFGTVPKAVMQAQRDFHDKQESCPELWFREWYAGDINKGRQAVAKLIAADVEDVVMVENASYAVNSIILSYPFKDGDVVICFDCAYKMVMEALRVARRHADIRIVYIPIAYPISSAEEIVDSFEKELEKHEKVAMCVLDHVSSMPSIVMPITRLTALAKQKHAMVLIDGAHAPGMEDIDVTAIGADLYTGNCHKWLFAPKGTAFLWTKRSVQSEDFPLPCVMSSTGKLDYIGRFEYTGTRDYTPFAALPAALAFLDSRLGGLQGMRAHNKALLHAASELVREKWQTFYVVPESMSGYMSNVALPSVQSMEHVQALEKRLFKEHDISIKCEFVRRRRSAGGASDGSEGSAGSAAEEKIYFVRLSAQVYLELSDFELMADTVLRLIPEIVV